MRETIDNWIFTGAFVTGITILAFLVAYCLCMSETRRRCDKCRAIFTAKDTTQIKLADSAYVILCIKCRGTYESSQAVHAVEFINEVHKHD